MESPGKKLVRKPKKRLVSARPKLKEAGTFRQKPELSGTRVQDKKPTRSRVKHKKDAKEVKDLKDSKGIRDVKDLTSPCKGDLSAAELRRANAELQRQVELLEAQLKTYEQHKENSNSSLASLHRENLQEQLFAKNKAVNELNLAVSKLGSENETLKKSGSPSFSSIK